MFDFWFEYKTVVPKGFVRVLGKLAELKDAGIDIYFFVGNHDLWMRDYFQKELNILMDKAIRLTKNNEKVFVLSIPDWGITPFGLIKKRSNISEEIDAYNKLVCEISSYKEIQYFNITDISRKVNEIDNLLTGDGLHPSPLMYSMWVDKVIDFFD